MALSNKFGWLVLTTGNKSEMSVGYTTLYGDIAGGFAVIKDVPKTLVYRLCESRNSSTGATVGHGPVTGAPIPVLDYHPRPLRRAQARPTRRGLAAAIRAARPHTSGLHRAVPEPRAADRAGAARVARWTVRSGWSTLPSTSAARPLRASRSPRARSAATVVCRSPTATGARAARCRRCDVTMPACAPALERCWHSASCSPWPSAAAPTPCRTSRSHTTSSRA